MNREFKSVLLCCWPEDPLERTLDILSMRKIEDVLFEAILNSDFDGLVCIFECGYQQHVEKSSIFECRIECQQQSVYLGNQMGHR